MEHNLGHSDEPQMSGGLYFILGALAVVVMVMFVVLSGPHTLSDNGQEQMRVETPHAALDLPQPPLMEVKYQSTICSPVQNKMPSCLAA
jgi:hypothetical protein